MVGLPRCAVTWLCGCCGGSCTDVWCVAGVDKASFAISNLAPGSIIARVIIHADPSASTACSPKAVAEDLMRQAEDGSSALRSGALTCQMLSMAEEPLEEVLVVGGSCEGSRTISGRYASGINGADGFAADAADDDKSDVPRPASGAPSLCFHASGCCHRVAVRAMEQRRR